MKDKTQIRQHIKKLKQKLCIVDMQKSATRVFSELEQLKQFKQANVIMAYWALPDELPTADFIEKWYRHKTILLPVMLGETLVVRQFKGKKNMKCTNAFGVLEPTGAGFPNLNDIDLIIVPGIAFDEHNYRLGRGKGFYDRFLFQKQQYKIGIGFAFQKVEKVPVDQHDVSMDMVLLG